MSGNTMKAVVQRKYGSPDDLGVGEVDVPVVGEHDVLIRVRAASVHTDVWHMVTGRPWALRLMGGGLLRPRCPIPGSDMAGVVESVGEGVTAFERGDDVFGQTVTSHVWTNGGAFAEFVSVHEERLAAKPANVTFEQAASVPSSGHIALQNLRDVERMQPGKTVLINGAGGGVGSLALQIVKSHGARVTAVDAPGKLEMLRQLGADEVLDHTREDFTARAARYDLVFDVPGNHSLSECRRVLRSDGRYVPIGHEGYGTRGGRVVGILPRFMGLMLLSRSGLVEHLRGPGAPPPGPRETLVALRGLLAAGRVTPVIDSVYPLSEAGRALRRLMEGEARGKVIITP